MVLIDSPEEKYIFTTTTYYDNKPDQWGGNTDDILDKYSDLINQNNSTINVSHEAYPEPTVYKDTDGIEHPGMRWRDVATIEIVNHQTDDDNPAYIPFSPPGRWDDPGPVAGNQRKLAPDQVHKKRIQKILNYILQMELAPYMDELFDKKKICKGHTVLNGAEYHGRNKNNRVKRDSSNIIYRYESDTANYKKCVTHTTGINDGNPRVRMSAVAYHVDNHVGCDCFGYEFFQKGANGSVELPDIENETIKKCIGHFELVTSIPTDDNTHPALQFLAAQILEYYRSHLDYKNEQEGYLKTHVWSRQARTETQDLYAFYQHKDNHEPCDHCVFLPAGIVRGKGSSIPPPNEPAKSIPTKDLLPQELNETKKELLLVQQSLQQLNFLMSQEMDLDSLGLTQLIGQAAHFAYTSLFGGRDPKEQWAENKQFWSSINQKVRDGRGLEQLLGILRFYNLDEEYVHDIPEIGMATPQDFTNQSKAFDLGKPELRGCRVFMVNGMNTHEEKARAQAEQMSQALGGANVHAVYNATQNPALDIIESARNLFLTATEASYILRDELLEYFENCNPDDVAYIKCHSQGAIMVRNTLLMLPPEIQSRIQVLAIAPAAYINIPEVKKVNHIASEWDFVHKFDQAGLQAAGENLTILPPAENASRWDHAENSPTFDESKNTWYREIKKHHNFE